MSDLPVSAVPIWGQYVQNPMTLSLGVPSGSMQMTQAGGLNQVHFLSHIKNSLTLHSQRRGPSAKPEKSRLFSRALSL